MPLSAYPGMVAGQSPAASLYNAPLATSGKIFYVNSAKGSDDSVGDDPARPRRTLKATIGRCRANQGDQIWLMPSHAEQVLSAGDIAMDVEGVSVYGLGQGTARPTFSFTTPDSSIAFTANNCGMFNVLGVPTVGEIATPFHVNANDCGLALEWRDVSTTIDALCAIHAENASYLTIYFKYTGFANSTNTSHGIGLNGCSHVDVTLNTFGSCAQGWVILGPTPCINVQVTGRTYTVGATSGSHNINDMATTSTYGVQVYDASAGKTFVASSTPSDDTDMFTDSVAFRALFAELLG